MDDYISRKSVTAGLDYIINELNKLITDDSPNDGYTDIKNQVEEIKRGVLNIPPEDVQPVVHWIPCSERLPDIGDIYIVLVDEKQLRPNESRVACAYWLDDKWQYGVLESYEHKMPKLVIEPLEELTVVAWMLLPEPYKGDDHAD